MVPLAATVGAAVATVVAVAAGEGSVGGDSDIGCFGDESGGSDKNIGGGGLRRWWQVLDAVCVVDAAAYVDPPAAGGGGGNGSTGTRENTLKSDACVPWAQRQAS